MKRILIGFVFFLFLAISAMGQMSFNNVIMQVPNTTTTMDAVEIGDISNDGLNDIVAGSVAYNNLFYEFYIVIYTQKMDGTMTDPISLNYSKSYQPLYDIELADMNNDKLNDIVIAFGTSVGIYYQLPVGGFSNLRILNGIAASQGIKTGDLNNDGLIDVLGFDNSTYKIFYQTKTGDFNLTSIPANQTNYTQLEVGDLNGDGLTDIANTYGSKIEILYQKKGLGITSTDSLILNSHNKDSYWEAFEGFTVADVNNDGKHDIVGSYGGNDGRMKIFYQTANGKIDTTNAKSYDAYDIPTAIKVADLNCDGDNEIIIGNNAWQKVSIYNKHNLADYGAYTLHPSMYYFTHFSMAVGDINNDSRPDIIDVDQSAKMSILYNTSKPFTYDSFEKKVSNLQIKRDTTSKDTIIYIAIADTAKICKKNNFLKQQIHQVINNEHYTGDSLLIRHGMLCNAYTDTIKTSFAFTKKLFISTDTIKSIENRDVLTFSIGSTTFSSTSNSGYAYINTNICWNISVDADWIKPSKYSGNNGGNGSIISTYVGFSINANPTIYARKAIISITGDGISPRLITINQQGAKPAINTSTSSLVLSEDVNNSAYLLIGANINWKINIDADWLTLDKNQGAPTNGDYEVITVEATPNSTDADRNALITINGDQNVVTKVTVKQLKKGLSALESHSKTDIRMYPNPIHDKLTIETDAQFGTHQIQICDLRGIVVYDSNMDSNKSVIDFSTIQKGIYFVKIKFDGSTVLKKIIKQ